MTDAIYILTWWVVFFVIGSVSLPLSWLVFRKFIDVGYGFSKTIGLLVVSYGVFLLGIFKIFPFERLTVSFVLAIYMLINIFIFYKYHKEIVSGLLKSKRVVLSQEILFTLGLGFWSLIRSYQPNILGLEKFMDLGFINSIMRSKFLPPVDMWFAGESINYYWFGHFVTAVVTKLSGLATVVTYNLMIATILGLVLVSVFSIVGTLSLSVLKKNNVKLAFAAGLISALLLNFAGNFQTPYFFVKKTVTNIQAKIECNSDPYCFSPRLDDSFYWYPDATRFVGYHPETEDKTIHEFPMYSYVVSDLHAHLLNLPFVILLIAVLARYVLHKEKSRFLSLIMPVGFLLGVFFMTSTWDFGNYLLATSIVFGIANLHYHISEENLSLVKAFFKYFVVSVRTVSLIFFVAIMVVLPFYVNFKSIAEGIDFVNARTPIWQLGVLWGFPAVLTITFVTTLKVKIKSLKKMRPADVFVFALLVSSWVLILLPEIFYVKDIYIASHHRANTMFKLTYQAFVMSYLTSGYVAIRALGVVKKRAVKVGLIVFFSFIFSIVLNYSRLAIDSYYQELKNYRGLQGDGWLEETYPAEYEIVSWFNSHIEGQPVVLEAQGDSYTDYNVISAYTGLPTVSGWYVHEWLWRGSPSFPSERIAKIEEIYTTTDAAIAKKLLDEFDVEYVVVGTLERKRYAALAERKFNEIGTRVFSSGSTSVYKLN